MCWEGGVYKSRPRIFWIEVVIARWGQGGSRYGRKETGRTWLKGIMIVLFVLSGSPGGFRFALSGSLGTT